VARLIAGGISDPEIQGILEVDSPSVKTPGYNHHPAY
jgi:hypothetical protein